MAYAIGLGTSLLVFWLLMSGIYKPLIIGLGVVSTLFVVWLARRMDVVDHESFPIQLRFRFLDYWGWLAREIFKANVAVVKIILSPTMRISPTMLRSKTTQETNVGLVTYANSITLTPGTVTIELEDGEVLVHALTEKFADDVLSGAMDKRVTDLERGPA